ncbi:hypothetical protein AB0N17_08500 [Streptomyces sp. NPDC051133]|uniref:hypothetical protein n=1 Tax=Streptomyces sp. NPDC051133 TaxID=3155521 RepID=UPI003445BAD8
MTPWLRLTLRWVRLLLALAAALPAYGTATAYATTAHAAGQSTAPPSMGGHPAAEGPGHPVPPGHEHRPPSAPAGEDGGRSTPAAPSAAPMPSDSASASYSPAVPAAVLEPTRAGSRAGEGRMRPGRPDGPMSEVEGDDDRTDSGDGAPTTSAAQPEEPETTNLPTGRPTASEAELDPAGQPREPAAQAAARQSEDASEPTLQILPLGTGLVLIGLGLGLAFLSLKLRKS